MKTGKEEGGATEDAENTCRNQKDRSQGVTLMGKNLVIAARWKMNVEKDIKV